VAKRGGQLALPLGSVSGRRSAADRHLQPRRATCSSASPW